MIVSAGTESWYLRFAEEPDGVKVHLVNAYIRKLFAEPLQLRSALLAWCTPTHAEFNHYQIVRIDGRFKFFMRPNIHDFARDETATCGSPRGMRRSADCESFRRGGQEHQRYHTAMMGYQLVIGSLERAGTHHTHPTLL